MSDESGGDPGAPRFTRRFREKGPNTYTVWKVSMTFSGIGLGVAALFFLAPHLRWLPLAGDVMIPVPIVAMALPLMGLGWAVAGFVMRSQPRSLALALALALSLAALAADAAAFWFDDIRPAYLYQRGLGGPPTPDAE